MYPCLWQISVQQADGSLAQITEAYNADDLGAVFSQFLNGTSTGLAAFAPMLTIALGSVYYSSKPPYTESIEASIATPVYITGVEVGSPRGGGDDHPFCTPFKCACTLCTHGLVVVRQEVLLPFESRLHREIGSPCTLARPCSMKLVRGRSSGNGRRRCAR